MLFVESHPERFRSPKPLVYACILTVAFPGRHVEHYIIKRPTGRRLATVLFASRPRVDRELHLLIRYASNI